MAYFTIQQARAAFNRRMQREFVAKSAAQILNEDLAKVGETDHFDIFLSHCLKDQSLIVGVKQLLEEDGAKVYVDWINDPQLDRANVTPANAAILRQRMRESNSLLFATSESSPSSKWMPWELGYFDGLRQGRVAILPLVDQPGRSFTGQEYLGLYPVVESLRQEGVSRPFVTRGRGTRTYLELGAFQKGAIDFRKF